MCNNYVNSNKLCYLPPDIYLGIVYVPDHPVYLVKLVTPTWKHPLWCDDLHLYVVYVCFTTQGRLFCFPKPYFPIRRAHHFRNIFIKIYNPPPCYPKVDCNIWLYSMLTEEEFDNCFQNQHLAGKNKQVYGYLLYTKCHQGQSHEGVAFGPMIIACEWVNNHNFILGFFNQRNNNC